MNNETAAVIQRFEDAFQKHDATGLADIIGQTCILENTGPAPDGARYEGHDACLSFWSGVANNPQMNFNEERVDILGDRALVFWRLSWGSGASESVRGVNIMRVQRGKIIEALGYVKG